MEIKTLGEMWPNFPDEPPGADWARFESAYRRGYLHGFSQAVDDMMDADTPDEVIEFFNDKLMPWRHAQAGSEMTDPPRWHKPAKAPPTGDTDATF